MIMELKVFDFQRYFYERINFTNRADRYLSCSVVNKPQIRLYGLTIQTLQWLVLAQKYNAFAFIIEHRYYGASRPYPLANKIFFDMNVILNK